MAEVRRREELSDAAQAVINSVSIGQTAPIKSKPPIFKRPWFIVVIVFLLFGLLGNCVGGSSDSDNSNEPPAASQTETPNEPKEVETPDEPEVVEADKSALNTILQTLEGISQDSVTAKSWENFQPQLQAAQNVANDPNATQEEVDEAAKNVRDASAQLIFLINPAEYQSPSYEDIARYPDDWELTAVTFTGEVVQLIEDTDEIDLRVAVNGDYDQMILVAYEPRIMEGTRVMEGDTVTLYGTYYGITSYTSTLGGEISVPLILVDWIDIK